MVAASAASGSGTTISEFSAPPSVGSTSRGSENDGRQHADDLIRLPIQHSVSADDLWDRRRTAASTCHGRRIAVPATPAMIFLWRK